MDGAGAVRGDQFIGATLEELYSFLHHHLQRSGQLPSSQQPEGPGHLRQADWRKHQTKRLLHQFKQVFDPDWDIDMVRLHSSHAV
jgi:hypothetical protein